MDNSNKNTNFETSFKCNGNKNETRLDNQGAMGRPSIDWWADSKRSEWNIRTIEACNSGGIISPNYEAEELEELFETKQLLI